MSESPVETPAVTEEGQEPEAQDASKLPAWAREALTKANSEAAKYRTQVRDLEPKAKQFDALEQASKSDIERFQEKLAETQREADEARSDAIRYRVATEHGIKAENLDLLGSGTEDEIAARAVRVAAMQAIETGARRPAPDTSQGSSATGRPPDQDAANWLQQLVRK